MNKIWDDSVGHKLFGQPTLTLKGFEDVEFAG
jgi:hypothetical protein